MTSFVTEALKREHPRAGFECGVPELDRYLQTLALQDVKRRIAGCYVALDDRGEIGGFYTLAAAQIPLSALSPDWIGKLPRYPVIPAMRIGRLAVSLRQRGLGLGRALVFDAILRTSRLGVGAYAVIVDAKDERAARFYRSNGFSDFAGESLKLFLPIETALKMLGAQS